MFQPHSPPPGLSPLRWVAASLAAVATVALGATLLRWGDGKGATAYPDLPSASADARSLDITAIEEGWRVAELEAIEAGAGTPVAGETVVDANAQRNVLQALVTVDQARAPECTQHTVVDTESLGRNVNERTVFERWTLARCSERVSYRLAFAPYAEVHDARRKTRVIVVSDTSSITIDPE
jgi:hypothetical protein